MADLLGHRDLRSVLRYKRGSEIKRVAVHALEIGQTVADIVRPKQRNAKKKAAANRAA